MESNEESEALNETSFSDNYQEVSDELCEFDTLKADFPVVRALWVYVGLPIFAVGIIGHSTTLLILLTNRAMRRQSLSVYLVAMSATSLVVLCSGLLPSIVKHHTCMTVVLGNLTTEFGCRVLEVTKYFALHMFSWTEASISAERLLAIRWPLLCRQWCTRRANAIAMAIMVCILLPVNVTLFWLIGYNDEGFCDIIDQEAFTEIWHYVNLALYAAFPVAVMLPCNALTLYTMQNIAFDSVNVKKARPVTIMMISLNALFFVTTFPIMTLDYNEGDHAAFTTVEIVWCVCRLVMYAGGALTFLVYVAVAARFRAALRGMLIAGKARIERALSRPSFAEILPGGSAFVANATSDRINECILSQESPKAISK